MNIHYSLLGLKLWQQAAELGNAKATYNIGSVYYNDDGVERDKKKANHYFELASKWGDLEARFNLGRSEWHAGNQEREFAGN